MFVSKKALEKEEDHLEGFAPEVAWVTKSGSTDLEEPIAIRPTSETIMYPSYSDWVQSYRDLPIRLNQWTNVVRWEFKHPTPFIRTREFLWQEGHTAHSTVKEAEEEVYRVLDFYGATYEELLAVPVIKGVKSKGETFPGADFTTTVELFVACNGRGIQGATSHMLGQNFSKMFDISFQNEQKQKEFAYQTSWGFTTRSIGAMIMVHGDDKGLVLPPRIASVQVVIIPILHKGKGTEEILDKAHELGDQLKKAGLRVKVDSRPNHNPGWKFAHWEVKGVPIRIELGKKDMEKSSVVLVKRNTGEKKASSWESLADNCHQELEVIQKEMLEKAIIERDARISKADNWEDFMSEINKKNLVLTPWCENKEAEETVKNKSKDESKAAESEGEEILTGSAKILCLPIDQEPLPEGTKCFFTGEPATNLALWGRSY